MDTLGLTTLVAYVDGELDAEESAAVEQHLASDPDARETVRKIRQSAVMVRSAYDTVLAEPVPKALVETVLTAPADAAPSPIVRRSGPSSWNTNLGRVAAMAAVLMIGLGGGFGVATYSGAVSERTDNMARDALRSHVAATRNQALETARSGVPVTWTSPDGNTAARVLPIRTYYSPDNGYCREYQRVTSSRTESFIVHGVACRSAEGAWLPQYELVKNAEIEGVSPW